MGERFVARMTAFHNPAPLSVGARRRDYGFMYSSSFSFALFLTRRVAIVADTRGYNSRATIVTSLAFPDDGDRMFTPRSRPSRT
jgi:hypothetical protein